MPTSPISLSDSGPQPESQTAPATSEFPPQEQAQPSAAVPLSAIEFQPKDCKGGDQPDAIPPVARPFLDCVFHWAASVPQSLSATGQVLCCCRLRIFRNGALGRATEWAVLITEHPQADDLLSHIARRHNPGVPARTCLAEIADLVKSGYLARAPYEQISWFLHDSEQTSKARPVRHHQLQRVQFNVHVGDAKCIYLDFLRVSVAPEELELAAGGLVEL